MKNKNKKNPKTRNNKIDYRFLVFALAYHTIAECKILITCFKLRRKHLGEADMSHLADLSHVCNIG
jgi:hypothetical protein